MIRSIDGGKKQHRNTTTKKDTKQTEFQIFFFHIPVFLNLFQASMYSCHDLLIPDSDSVRLPFAALQPKCDQIIGRYAQTISFLLTLWFSALTRGMNSQLSRFWLVGFITYADLQQVFSLLKGTNFPCSCLCNPRASTTDQRQMSLLLMIQLTSLNKAAEHPKFPAFPLTYHSLVSQRFSPPNRVGLENDGSSNNLLSIS